MMNTSAKNKLTPPPAMTSDRRPDFTVHDAGQIHLLRPLTEPARRWCVEYLTPDCLAWGRSIPVEARLIRTIVPVILDAGFNVDIHTRRAPRITPR